jgi:lysine-specific demethylase/histidyl-hydroxylase NO66
MTTVHRVSAADDFVVGRESSYDEGLLRLVDGLDQLAAVWEREPLVTTGRGPFSDIFSTTAADRLLRSGIPLSAIRVIDHGEKPSVDRFARPLEFNARSRQRYADLRRVSQAMAAGGTLVMEELQTFSAEVGAFAALLARQTGYRTDCAAFLTPAHSRGCDPHIDPVSIFLLQIEGAKRWRISRIRERWPNGIEKERMEGAQQVLDVVLHAGDCLYLPRGFVHVGETTESASVHLSISMSTDTWAATLLRALSVAAPGTELLREMPPPLFDPGIDPEPLFEQRRELLAKALSQLQYRDVATALPAITRGAAAEPNLFAESLHGVDWRMELT